MKRWTNTWAALLVTGFLAVPSSGFAQTPAAPPTSPASPTATAEQASPATPQEHLQRADAAVNSIASSAVTGKTKSQIAELKKHLSALQKVAGTAPAKAPSNTGATASAGSSKWATEAAAADKIFGELLADAGTTSSANVTAPSEPKPTGTSGTTSKAAATVAMDEETRAKLTSARASLMAFAAAMSGSASTAASSPSSSASASSATATSPSTASSATTATPPATTTPTEPTPASPASPTSPATPPSEPSPATPPAPTPAQPAPTAPAEPTSPAQPAPTAPTSPAEPTSPAQPPTSSTAAAQPSTTSPAQAALTGQAKVDADAAKAALTAARDSLSQMTQLPAAQQLSGENRTQVTQLIANFNELITTNSEWKAAYAKVDANITALIGDQTTSEPAAAPAAPVAGTAGAVGTSGTTTSAIDAGVKAKLVEFRTHLKAFEKAAGGAVPK